jgi:hypothetical protein
MDRRRKLSSKDVERIRTRRRGGERLKAIAADFGVSISTISRVSDPDLMAKHLGMLRRWRRANPGYMRQYRARTPA